MSFKKIFLLFTILSFYSCNGQRNNKPSEKMNGLSFVASNRQLVEKDTESVVNANANWVALMPFGFMPNATTPTVSFNKKRQWWGETAIGIKTTSTLFQKKKIKRMLKPQIWIRGGVFTGTISMPTEKDWLLFEKNYEDFILHYAKLAQNENIELFCMGTELTLFVQKRPEFWKNLIAKTKQVYKGKITYAANWDSYTNATFWQEIDYIGIDAYFPLSTAKTPSVTELKQAWLKTKTALKNYSQKKQKPIIFTEFGYRSVDYSAKEPWDSEVIGNYNHTAQQNALTAVFETFWNEPWFAGGFLWKWFDNHADVGGNNHTGFTVQNKTTENLIKSFYKNQ